jgi:hypothetical protein
MPFLYVKLFALAAVMFLFLGWITTRKTDSRLGARLTPPDPQAIIYS